MADYLMLWTMIKSSHLPLPAALYLSTSHITLTSLRGRSFETYPQSPFIYQEQLLHFCQYQQQPCI
jgi:hypothetical protein